MITAKTPPPALYEIDPVPPDEAVAGARLAIADNDTTAPSRASATHSTRPCSTRARAPVDAARKLADGGDGYIVANLPADDLLAVADALKDRNVASSTSERPTTGCAAPIAAPTSSMSRRAARC